MAAPIRIAIYTVSPTMRTLLAGALGSEAECAVVETGVLTDETVKTVTREEDTASIDALLFDIEAGNAKALDIASQLARRRNVPSLLFIPKLESTDAATYRGYAFTTVRRRPDIHSLTQSGGRAPIVDLLHALRHVQGHSKQSTVSEDRSPPQNTESPRDIQGPAPRGILVIGASTGGPQAVRRVLFDLPNPISLPVVIVQHISHGFTEGFVRWLRDTTHRDVVTATHGLTLHRDRIYVAPAGLHTHVRPTRLDLLNGEKRHYQRPSADILFESAAAAFQERVVAILLTGMGRDGAEGCLAVREAGGITLVQDEETSVVYGMPRAAAELGAATEIRPLEQIGSRAAYYALRVV